MTFQQSSDTLAGTSVLVVEDEPLISMLLVEILEELGCEVSGAHATLESGQDAIDKGNFDVALIDLYLGGARADALLEKLSQMGKPYALASGAEESGFGEAVTLRKPYAFDQVAKAVSLLRSQMSAA